MFRPLLTAMAIAGLGLMSAQTPVFAQAADEDLYLEQDGTATSSGDATIEAEGDGSVDADDDFGADTTSNSAGTRVFGFRSGNCGEFKYWNGEFCADARDKTNPDR